jgi:phosphoenolpyruvate carboxykinase (GTP)
MEPEQFKRISRFEIPAVILKIANAIAMCQPDHVFINTSTAADKQYIRDMALQKGEEEVLPMKGHTLHFDLKEEQGRIIDRTYYVANDDELVSSLALRMSRPDALETVRGGMVGIMRGKTMIVGFYSRGPAGAPVSNPAIEITSSAYVSHSAELLYRNIFNVFEREARHLDHFYTNIHSEGLNRPEDLPDARVLMDRAHRTTYSYKCTYAGNTLLMKKGNHRFSVDRSVYEKRGRELAEHMFITCMEGSNGRRTGIAGAAPSGCGKTTTAMAGDYFVGDDLAQMWIAEDGSVRSVNPECGIFGILEDVNWEGDPVLMRCLREPGTEVIWSNVLVDEKGKTHWTGSGEAHPA